MYPQPIGTPNVVVPTGWTIAVSNEPGSAVADHSFGDGRIDRTYTVRYKMFSSNPDAGPLAAISASGIRIGDTYAYAFGAVTETDTGSFVVRMHAEGPVVADGKGYQYTLTVECAPVNVAYLYGSSNLNNHIINPTDMRPQTFFDSAKYKRSKPTDESDPPVPYVNTIGDPLLDPPETEETRPVLKIIRNEPFYNDSYASSFKDTVNLGPFLDYPANTVKCRDIRGERFYDADWGYWFKVTYEFEFRDDDDGNGYTQQILNAGYRQKVNGSGNPVNVVDSNGQQVTDAVPLQKNGAYSPTASPYFLQFAEFPSSDFDQLNLPVDILFEP